MCNPYRAEYFRYVPWLYKHDPDAIRPDIRNAYEDHLDALAENMDDPDPVPAYEGTGSSFDFDAYERDERDVRERCVAVINGEAPWTFETWVYYLENRDEIEALAA